VPATRRLIIQLSLGNLAISNQSCRTPPLPSRTTVLRFASLRHRTARIVSRLCYSLQPLPTLSNSEPPLLQTPPQSTMSFDWTHQFCLACDKQTDGATYCSESCRLADYEKTSSTPSSGPSSPAFAAPSYQWTFAKPAMTNTKFYLSPAFDFSSPHLSGRTLQHGGAVPQTVGTRASGPILSPSTSHTSLCSIRSTSSAGLDAAQLSEKAARELRAYARSFESVRLQRRRSH
jgi:hypothetical protein